MKTELLPKPVQTYLNNHAFQQWKLEWNRCSGIEMAVVVPAIKEYANIRKLLKSLIENDKVYLNKTLVIFVVNHSVSSEQAVKDDNHKSLELLLQIINKNYIEDFVTEVCNSGIKLGIINAASEGKEFDDKNAGVGLARKTGMDEALKVFDYSLTGKKIIISLDADCTADTNYLSEIHSSFNTKNINAATVEFEHNLTEKEINKSAILSYEIFLRHYVAGLLYAGSPFAFHTIGSTIVLDHEAYIKIGGMNKKPAAEDFYFLQKLAKNYSICRITSATVKPSARESWRVPFGTGRSMIDYNSNGKQIRLYDPYEYLILKEWLGLFNSDAALNTEFLLKETIKINKELYSFLESKNFSKDWERILENSKTEKQLIYQRKNWFDAFKTLKLIHHLRDTSFPMLNIKEGVEKLFKHTGQSFSYTPGKQINDVDTLQNYLSELRTLENCLSEKSLMNIPISSV